MHVGRGSLNEVERDSLNSYALERVRQYQRLKIANFEVPTPFFSNDIATLFGQMMLDAGLSRESIVRVFEVYNNNQVPFGWYRGKGTPEQITSATEKIAKLWGLDLQRATNSEVIVEFMKAAGLGIDCSGFVYQTLEYALDKAGYPDLLDNVLQWPDSLRSRNEYKAGIRNFADGASRIIQPLEVQPMDIIVIKSLMGEKYSHMALVLKDGDSLVTTQSVIGQVPTGVHVSPLRIENGLPQFGFRPNLTDRWEELYVTKRLEFRRLKVF